MAQESDARTTACLPDYLSRWKASSADLTNCPIKSILDRIFGKWPILILLSLYDRPHRYGELSRVIPGISRRVLSQTLKGLEEDGLILRRELATNPIGTEYSLSALGTSLIPLLIPIFEWAGQREFEILKDVKDARNPPFLYQAN